LIASNTQTNGGRKETETLARQTVKNKSLNDFGGNEWTERGTELEDSARSLYEMVYDCEVKEVGLCMDDEGTYIASPDGLIGDDGVLEIKCLKASNHIKAIIYHAKNRKPPTDYISQVQMQLFVTGRKWCDLVFYHPDLPELIIRIEPDLTFHMVLIKQLKAVIEERDRIVSILNAI